jgi:hypothetical protein
MQSWIQFRNKNKPTPGLIRSDKLRRLRGVNVQCRPTEPGGRSGTAGEPPQAPAAGVLGQFERRRMRDPDRALHMAWLMTPNSLAAPTSPSLSVVSLRATICAETPARLPNATAGQTFYTDTHTGYVLVSRP